MKKILLIGRLNGAIKEINQLLAQHFYVQLCSENANTVEGMMKIVNPDLVLISLVGAYDMDTSIFCILKEQYTQTPVLTIGTREQTNQFFKYYENNQFENLIRPIENAMIIDAVFRRLKWKENEAKQHIVEEKKETIKKKRILVVDDNGTALRTIKVMLEEYYEVAVAISGAQAMTSIGKQHPDLILLDYEMPICDGKMTLEMIRADKDMKDIPVIFLTAVNDRENIEAVLRLKPAGYLLKPPIKKRLIAEIDKVLKNS